MMMLISFSLFNCII